MGIHLDLNFNFKTEGYLQVVRALDDLGLTWFEIDLFDPPSLRKIHDSVRTPIASCESLYAIPAGSTRLPLRRTVRKGAAQASQ